MEFNSTLKGLNLDVNELQNEGVLYSFALNATIENHSEPQPEPYRSNMASNVFCYSLSPNEKIEGHLYVPEFNKTLIFTYNKVTRQSCIVDLKVLDKDPYTSDVVNCEGATQMSYVIQTPQCASTILACTSCFDWSESPKAVYKITDCTINLYFVNGKDEDRLLNFDYDSSYNLTISKDFLESNNQDCNITYTNQIACSKTKWNPDIAYPCIKLDSIPGNKQKGSYEYLLAYSTYSGIPLTSFKSLTQPIHIGKNGGGIKVSFENITQDSRYKFFTLVEVATIKGITTYHQKGTFSINQKNFIDNKDGGPNISIENLLAQYPFYKSSGLITESNNLLFKADLDEYEKFNLQPVINKVEVEWATIVGTEGDYADPEFANQYKTFLRDENYMLAIELTLDNSEQGPSFPLVGRQATLNDRQVIDNIEYSCDLIASQRWQLENTATVTYTNPKSLNELAKKCDCKEVYQTGTFSYWESTELYPNNPTVWGDLCSQPIRGFKFPDVRVSPHMSNNPSYDTLNYIFPIGIKIKSDLNILFDEAVAIGLITQQQRNRIKGYKILRSDRLGNESIIAKGLLYDVWSYKRTQEEDPNFLNNCDVDTISVWTNQGASYCVGTNLYQDQVNQFGENRSLLLSTNSSQCSVVPIGFSSTSTTDGIWGVAHGQNGHHFVRNFVDITGYTPGNTLWVSVSGEASIPYFQVSTDSFSFKFPHSNCCGSPGCGYIVSAQERDSTGVTIINTDTNPAVELCPVDDLYSAQNPEILTCSVTAGALSSVNVKSIPAIAGYTIRAFLDGDDTYTPVASGTTNSLGIANISIPNTVNGQKYWISQEGNGYKESFGNSVVIGGNCVNFKLNETFVCGVGGANVTFNPSGGSGNYSYSLTNNDAGGYNPLTTIFLPNGTNQVYVRDNTDFSYKIMYSIIVTC